jgi:hypothetical protein
MSKYLMASRLPNLYPTGLFNHSYQLTRFHSKNKGIKNDTFSQNLFFRKLLKLRTNRFLHHARHAAKQAAVRKCDLVSAA